VSCTLEHRHGPWSHEHHHHGSHRHARLPIRSRESHHDHDHDHAHDHHHAPDADDGHGSGHGHTHGKVDPSIVRSRAGVRAVAISLAVLGLTAALQAVVFASTRSVALLADIIHNGGDALTAIPLAIAFWARSKRGERWAGYAVVLVIFASASIAGFEAIERLIHPRQLEHLGALAIAGVIGFVGNELAARVRLRAGERLHSPALLADGHHARVDGFVSLGVIASAIVVAIGFPRADPIIGLAITGLILRITWQAWRTVSAPDEPHDDHGSPLDH
jgi:divalent metal cation (Fe/Co/Zn/Cd) transporter